MLLTLIVLASLHPSARPIPVRDAYRRVAFKAVLVIERSHNNNEGSSDIHNALDALQIEAQSPDEFAVAKLITKFYLDEVVNGGTYDLIMSSLNLAEIEYQGESEINGGKTDPKSVSRVEEAKNNFQARQNSAKADLGEIARRNEACSEAIKAMLQKSLTSEIPTCKNVVVPPSELKTKFDEMIR